MKKTIICATLLAASFLARAESIHVHLPAGFPATGTYLPAGDYSISPVNSSSSILLIKGEGVKAFVFGRIVESGLTRSMTVEFEKGTGKEKTTAGMLKLASPIK